ncbi:MAG: hypothetical protein KGQ41_01400 [Alphaproteobacteria bacterium]|nr:hypothetical protein [Alphaproteobacteria bacterium]
MAREDDKTRIKSNFANSGGEGPIEDAVQAGFSFHDLLQAQRTVHLAMILEPNAKETIEGHFANNKDTPIHIKVDEREGYALYSNIMAVELVRVSDMTTTHIAGLGFTVSQFLHFVRDNELASDSTITLAHLDLRAHRIMRQAGEGWEPVFTNKHARLLMQ